MGRAMLALAIVTAGALGAACPAWAKGGDKDQKDDAALVEAEDARVAAENRHDGAELARILDGSFVCSFNAEAPLRLKAFVDAITSSKAQDMRQELTERTFVVSGDTGVVVETDTVRGTMNGQAFEEKYRVTVTYARRHGKWQALAEHLVRS